MSTIQIGTSAYPNANLRLLQEAGIAWIRQDFSFPFKNRLGGDLTPEYEQQRASAALWVDKGLRVLGVTPLIGIGLQKPDAAGRMQTTWHDHVPDYMGKPGTDEFLTNYFRLCSFLAEDLRGIVSGWQILNELDIFIFAGPLNPRQAGELVLHSARALKYSDPSLVVGTNTAGSDKAYFLYGYLFTNPVGLMDYCGVDGYYGTWSPGGPGDWVPRIAELYALTGVQVLVNEWGYASTGGLLSEEERRGQPYVCQHKKWYHAWDAGHTPEVQGRFVEQVFEGFYQVREKLFGAFFYRWEDQDACWQCGAPDCPAETAWGLVSAANQPKPAYFAFQSGVKKLLL